MHFTFDYVPYLPGQIFFFACVYSKYSEIIDFNLDDQLQWY